MSQPTKPIRISDHASANLVERGADQSEVVLTIRSEPWGPAELGRLECRRNFAFEGLWHKRSFSTKQVRPIFVDEPSEIVVVTVYVYYF